MHLCAALGQGHDVALERRGAGKVDAARGRSWACHLRSERQFVDRAARSEDRFLGKHRRQATGVFDQVEAAIAELAHVLQRRHIRALAQRDHTGGDAARLARADQRKCVIALFRVVAVGEEQQMLELDVLFGERLEAGFERQVHEDPAAAGADCADRAFDLGFVEHWAERHVHCTAVSTCITPRRSPAPSSSALRAAASLASSSLVCEPALIAMEPE